MNGDLQGVIDYWVRVGAENRVWGDDAGGSVSVEAVLNHFCRHLASIANPYVLNLNELMGRVVVRSGGAALGAGFGPFIGGSRGYGQLASFTLDAAPFLLPEASFAGELKWVDFERFYYEATLSVGLGGGAEIFLRAARHYDYPAAAYLGLRLRSNGPLSKHVGDFNATVGVYPYYDVHKLLVVGSYRLPILRGDDRRFLAAIDFQTPLLSGSGFWGQFWPDRMIHAASAEYERTLPGGMRAAWYARYVVDMPVDKAVRFRSHLATGLLLRNQPEFERLDKPIRFEVAAGYDFAFDFDARIKLGANARLGTGTGPGGGGVRPGSQRRAPVRAGQGLPGFRQRGRGAAVHRHSQDHLPGRRAAGSGSLPQPPDVRGHIPKMASLGVSVLRYAVSGLKRLL